MEYRKIPYLDGLAVLEKCDSLGINYDVWNAETLHFHGTHQEPMELGMESSDWDKLEAANVL